MKRFHCECGQPVFFESTECVSCGRSLGFDPISLEMRSLPGHSTTSIHSQTYKRCSNAADYDNCNWLLNESDPNSLCFSCQFNRTIPNLSKEKNLERWAKIENAKRRLMYTMLSLRLPLINGFNDANNGLVFDFLEDQRTDPSAFSDSFASIGYLNGVITINVLEADDGARESIRVEMNELYRTLLGHMRHESGHYFWQLVENDENLLNKFRSIFGDERADYKQALNRYYESPSLNEWRNNYISQYASAHPMEDWAESWAHYLHIHDVMETVSGYFLNEAPFRAADFEVWIRRWGDVSIAVNEINRGSGLGDPYPFVLNENTIRKMQLVNEVITSACLHSEVN